MAHSSSSCSTPFASHVINDGSAIDRHWTVDKTIQDLPQTSVTIQTESSLVTHRAASPYPMQPRDVAAQDVDEDICVDRERMTHEIQTMLLVDARLQNCA
mmetsp:Transcript_12902/g.35639  ORF Transcript_12902/g.35639 Transcript_12902/m.35639 type:complete len:100 (-) Transcript_12902:601-900(-)